MSSTIMTAASSRDFIGAGSGVLGIATPEYLAAEGSTQIVEGWMIIGGQPDWFGDSSGAPISGVVTHEFGHAINLAHTQTNGFYARNKPIPEWGLPPGPDQAGPDQCGHVVADYPTADQIETMYPFIDPFPDSIAYNSPQMATVNVADDIAALSPFTRHRVTGPAPARSRGGSSPRTERAS